MRNRKIIRKTWFSYMVANFNTEYSSKFGKYDPTKHSIRDSGGVTVNGKYGRELLEEVGMDYGTFRMKYNTMENPLETGSERGAE